MTLALALGAVDANAADAWKATADQIITNLAKTRRTFNSDDIWEGLFLVNMHTHEHRAMGPRILSAVKRNVIRIASCDHCQTKKVMVSSKREEAHSMDIPVYESLIYGELVR